MSDDKQYDLPCSAEQVSEKSNECVVGVEHCEVGCAADAKKHRQRKRKPKKNNGTSNTEGTSAGPTAEAGEIPLLSSSDNISEMIALLGITLCNPAGGTADLARPLESLPSTENVIDISKVLQRLPSAEQASSITPGQSSKEETRAAMNKKKKKRKKSTKEIEDEMEHGRDEVSGAASRRRAPPVNQQGTPRHTKRHGKPNDSTPRKEDINFEPHWTSEQIEEGIKTGQVIKGPIRINQKNYKEAYINSPDNGQDILIDGVRNRNRALEGDTVAVALLVETADQKQAQGPRGKQRRGKVVAVEEQNHSRACVGFLRPMPDGNTAQALFSPRDSRVPRLRIPMSQCPADFLHAPDAYKDALFLAHITDWKLVPYGLGELRELLGQCGEIIAESTALLSENDLNTDPYPANVMQFMPPNPYVLSPADFVNREDLREQCIFTVDPATAKDLDDAMSCRKLDNGNLEVGVHIADVAYFLHEDTPLDKAVGKRATSVYLVDTVHHMLPTEMCLMLSLLPGEDKLAFSVFWEMTHDAVVISRRFTRSVINSCTKLAYEHAQAMLENPDKVWGREELPNIVGKHTPADVSGTICILHSLALKMRQRRFQGGALRIDQTKIQLSLDHVTGLPTMYTVYINQESHRLIEEFMLLANMTVATHLKEVFPDVAFLRCHPPPRDFLIEQLQSTLEMLGVHLDVSSAGKLHTSLSRYSGSDFVSQARMMVLYTLCARPMARARYFCASLFEDAGDHWHYALNVPLYTHFTSPIRRYADVMVHRLLAAALGYQKKPHWKPDFVQKIASNCNKQKYAAKLAGEQSIKLYLTVYVGLHQPMLEEAVVVDVKDHSFDVLVCNLGLTQRIYTNNLVAEVAHESKDKISTLHIRWPPTPQIPYSTGQVIEIFSLVRVELCRPESTFKIDAKLVRPTGSGVYLQS